MTYSCHLKVSYCSFNEITKSATGNQVLTDPQNEFTSLPAHYRAENVIIAGTWSTSHKTEELWAIKALQCQTGGRKLVLPFDLLKILQRIQKFGI